MTTKIMQYFTSENLEEELLFENVFSPFRFFPQRIMFYYRWITLD